MDLYIEIAVFILSFLAVITVPFVSRNNHQAYYIPFFISILSLVRIYWNEFGDLKETLFIMCITGATIAGIVSLLLYHIKWSIKNRGQSKEEAAIRKLREKPIALLLVPPITLTLCIYMLALTFSDWTMSSVMLDNVGVTQKSAVIELAFFSIFLFALSIGLWSGKKWGWWISGIFCFYRLFVAIKGLFFLNFMLGELNIADDVTRIFKVKVILRLFFYSCCLLYLYRPYIIKHFGVLVASRKRSILQMFLISVAILIAFFLMHTIMMSLGI